MVDTPWDTSFDKDQSAHCEPSPSEINAAGSDRGNVHVWSVP